MGIVPSSLKYVFGKSFSNRHCLVRLASLAYSVIEGTSRLESRAGWDEQ